MTMAVATLELSALPRRDSLSESDEPVRPLARLLAEYFDAMSATLGPMRWWPAKTPFEVIVGAILTQNTAWSNVKLALDNLRQERLLTVQAMSRVPQTKLARLIRSSGYFRQKAKKLKAFLRFLEIEYSGSLSKMFLEETQSLRQKLLTVHGIGPETADSILLYAGRHPVFVVDAYTNRLLSRHGVISDKSSYEEVQHLFMANLLADERHFNEFHALIVNVGKKWCRAREPRCAECPLKKLLPVNGSAVLAAEPCS